VRDEAEGSGCAQRGLTRAHGGGASGVFRELVSSRSSGGAEGLKFRTPLIYGTSEYLPRAGGPRKREPPQAGQRDREYTNLLKSEDE